MYPHQERALQKVKDHFEQDPTVLALLFGGSLAKGWGSETSDVDIMLIVTEEELLAARPTAIICTSRPISPITRVATSTANS